MKNKLLPLLALSFSLQALSFNEKAYRYMDGLALQANTDKSSLFHNYTKVYSQFFDDQKDLPVKFLEIGVYQGSSVKLWENYFRNGELHFIDIDYTQLIYSPERAQLHTGDQANSAHLLALMSKVGGDFDIIIDDGGHTMQQQQVSFKTLFPYLKSGGVYVIEDLHTSYWSSYNKPTTVTTVNFLKNLIDEVNFVGNKTRRADHDTDLSALGTSLTTYRKDILSLTFYDSLCFIIKR